MVLRVRGTKALLWGGGGSYRGPEDSWEQAVETAHPALEWVTAVHLQEKWCRCPLAEVGRGWPHKSVGHACAKTRQPLPCNRYFLRACGAPFTALGAEDTAGTKTGKSPVLTGQ